jgi:3-phenylpropionate/cinnamic acid dioxygenase small subunit
MSTDIRAISDIDLWFSITQFYSREARYLDDLEFDKWVGLLAEDLRYWMPIVSNRIGRGIGSELTERGHLAHFEDDYVSMSNRVKRLATGRAWAETPPGRTNHMVSNVEIVGKENKMVQVTSKFLIYRSHMETDQEVFSGTRKDVLREDADTKWKVADRTIVLDHAVLMQKSLGIFF